MNPSELKQHHEAHNPDSYYFTRQTMRFFGDSMKNYGVRKATYKNKPCYELHRKRPVKNGLQASAFFCAETFKKL